MQANNKQFRGIYVTADDPKFLESKFEQKAELLDLDALNVASIREKYLARQRNFDTAPFDPEGRSLKFFPGGYTVWSGFPGAGKTTLLRQLACHLITIGKRVMVASIEEHPEDVFFRHAGVALGIEEPSQAGLEWCIFHWGDKLRIWSSEEMPAPHARLLAAVRVMAAQGYRHVIIDSLMCLDISNSDWEGQRQFANALVRTLKLTGVHIHLVGHPRKLISSEQEPDQNDVAGSADIGRLADNIVFVRKPKLDLVNTDPKVTPMKVSILKQRHGNGATGDCLGWFHRDQKQFKLDQFDVKPLRYLPKEAYEENSP